MNFRFHCLPTSSPLHLSKLQLRLQSAIILLKKFILLPAFEPAHLAKACPVRCCQSLFMSSITPLAQLALTDISSVFIILLHH
jgi:hypothetical protein